MASTPREVARDVLSRRMADELWTGNYNEALPITISGFELSAVLPVIFYMFRFGQRRGRGQFVNVFAPEGGTPRQKRQRTTIDRIAFVLANEEYLTGFDDDPRRTVLGDLLLCFGLENVRHELGRDKQVQRAFPTHYMTSWIDLPERVASLRGVPEMLVATLANQKKGSHIERTDKGWFRIGADYNMNPLLYPFSKGMSLSGPAEDRSSDQFDEDDEDVGLDQLLMIRLAETLRAAPDKAHGKDAERIPNQRPIATLAARHFSEDIRRFLRSYASATPRQALVDMLEACISVGMTTIFTSTVRILFKWSESGYVLPKHEQSPASLFIDSSTGVENDLRLLSEHSLDDLLRQVERVPETLATLRLLDYIARRDRKISKLNIGTRPHAGKWLNLLGELLHGCHSQASFIHQSVDHHCSGLADEFETDRPDLAALLLDETGEPNAIRRFARGLTEMMGTKVRSHLFDVVDSILQANRPNGLAQKRNTTRGGGTGRGSRRNRDVRSLTFSDAALEHLVHVHVLPATNKTGVVRLSMRDFLKTLRDRYGFYIDVAPQGMSISNELLQLNRRTLERRLRDLGLLVGVNDAESMKRLRPRFEPKSDM